MSPLLGSIGGISEYNYRGTLDDWPDPFVFGTTIIEPGSTVGISTIITGINYKASASVSNGAQISVRDIVGITSIYSGDSSTPSNTVTVSIAQSTTDLNVGKKIRITNCSDSAYNGDFTISSIIDGPYVTRFTYEVGIVPSDATPGVTTAQFDYEVYPFTADQLVYIRNSQILEVKVVTPLLSSGDFDRQYQTTVRVGKRYADWNVRTRLKDDTPDPFTFTSIIGLQPGIAVTSNSITVQGLEPGFSSYTFISSGIGSFSLNGSPGITTADVSNGDVIFMYETASLNYATTKTSELTLGTYTTPFSIRTRNAFRTPDQFNFNTLVNVPINQDQVSITTSITGTDNNIPLPASVSFPGELQVNSDQYVSGSTEVFNGDNVNLKIPASAIREYGTNYTTQLTISGITGTFSITTRPRPLKTFPDQFNFSDLINVSPSTFVESSVVTLSGMTNGENDTGLATITGGGAQFKVIRNGTIIRNYSSDSFPVLNSDQIQLRILSAGEGSTVQTQFTVSGVDTRTNISGVNGSTSDIWNINSRSLVCRINETSFRSALSTVESARLRELRTTSFTVSGLDNGCDTVVSTSNADSYIRNQNGVQVSSNQLLDIKNGDVITIYMTAASTYSTNKQTTVSCRRRNGSDLVSGTWTIRTQLEDKLPDPFNLSTRNQSSVSPCTFRTTYVTESLSGLSEETVVSASVTSTNNTAEISKNGGTFATSISGGVRNGDRIDVRMRSNCSFSGPCETATVTVGERTETWTLCPEQVPFPTVNLQTNATSIANGGSVTLTWTSTNADRVSSSSGTGFTNITATSGTLTIKDLTSSTTFSITVANARGTATSSVSVNVAAPPPVEPPPPPPCCDEYYVYRYGLGGTDTFNPVRTATITHFYDNSGNTTTSLTVSGDPFLVNAINTLGTNIGARYYTFDTSSLGLLSGLKYTVSVSNISTTTGQGGITNANITVVPGYPSYDNSGFSIAFQRQGIASLGESTTSQFGTFCRQFTITLTQENVSRRGRWYKSSSQFNTWFPLVSLCQEQMKAVQDIYVDVLNRPAGINEIESAIDSYRVVGANTFKTNLLATQERASIISSGNPLDPNNTNFNRAFPKTFCNRDYSALPINIFLDSTFSDNPADPSRDLRTNGIFSACSSAPTISISASSRTISHNGSVTLTWTSTNSTSVAYSNFGASSVGGSLTISNLTSTTSSSTTKIYTIRVAGPGGIATASVTITILPPDPTITLSANPSSIPYNGSTTLTWGSTNATSVQSSNFGATQPQGSTAIANIVTNQNYTITVINTNNKTATATASVNVSTAPPTINICATNITDSSLASTQTCDSTKTVGYGAQVRLNWTSTNATLVTSTSGASFTGIAATIGTFTIPNAVTSSATYSIAVSGPGGTATDSITINPQECVATTTQDSLAGYKLARSTFGNGTVTNAPGYEAYYTTVTQSSIPNRPNYSYRRVHAFIYNNYQLLLGRPPEKTGLQFYTDAFITQPSVYRTFDDLYSAIKAGAAIELSNNASKGGLTSVIDTCGRTWSTSSPAPNIFLCNQTITSVTDTSTNAIYQKGFATFANGTNDSIQDYFVSSIDPNLRLPGRPEFTYGTVHAYIYSKYTDANSVGGLGRPPEKTGLQTYVGLFQEKNSNGSYKYPDLNSLGVQITESRFEELSIRNSKGGFISIVNECGEKWILEGNGVYLDLRNTSPDSRVTVTLSVIDSSPDVEHSLNIIGIDRMLPNSTPKTFELRGGRIYGPCSGPKGPVYIGNEIVPGIPGSGSRPNTQVVVEKLENNFLDSFVVSTSAGVWRRFTAPTTK